MTRPGYNRRPSLPCADSVALMSHVYFKAGKVALAHHVSDWDMTAIEIAIRADAANTPLGADDHQMRGSDLRPAARRLMLYPWYFAPAES